VFTDPALSSQAGRFVWLELNTEKAENAAFLRRTKVPALPTFFVVDPADERIALRWVGGATVTQLGKMLDDGERSVNGASVLTGGPEPGVRTVRPPITDPAELAFMEAESLYAAGQYAPAADRYESAIGLSTPGWEHYGRAVESVLFCYSETDADEKSAQLSRTAFPRLRNTSSAGNVAASGLDAAVNLPPTYPGRDGLVAALENNARIIAADRSVPMAADDRSAVYISLHDARLDARDSTGAKRVAGEWAEFLEGEAAKAPTPDARAVFDSHRLAAYQALGQPERAVPMLQASERDLPGDYNPPARLAIAYRDMHRWNDALAASDRALDKAYGPRTLTMLQVRTDIYLGMADTTQARSTLERAIRTAEALPEGQRSDRSIASLKKRLASLQ